VQKKKKGKLGNTDLVFRKMYSKPVPFYIHLTVHRDNFFIIKPTRSLISQIYFGNETLHASDSSSPHHQELFTVHSAMVYVIQVCRQLASRIRMELQFHPDPARYKPV
jgi:hypothetical protein